MKIKCITFVLCICILRSDACSTQEININQEFRMNKMNGSFLAHDNVGNPIMLEWVKLVGKNPLLAEKINGALAILIPAYTEIELEFAQKYPEAIAQDFMLKSLNPLFEQGLNNVDWQLIEQKISEILQQFFATMDWTQHVGEQDIHYIVEATDQKTGKKLGFMQFFRTAEFAADNYKVALYGVLPTVQNCGIEKLLMDTVMQLFPTIKRIFLHTRVSNERAIQLYSAWGFTQFPGSSMYWIDMEYIVKK